MIDLMAEEYRLWGLESENDKHPPAEVAEIAENAQLRALPPADDLRTDCGNPQSAVNPQPIRNASAARNPHDYGKSAESAESAESAAPAHEIERIIKVLSEDVGRDLGTDLKDLMRRAMRSLDRHTRATLAAEIDDAFEQAASIQRARERAALAAQRYEKEAEPVNVDDWVRWITEHCPLLPEDARFIRDRFALMTAAHMATAARWYARAWLAAAESEPKPHKKSNAGRRAANATLLRR